MKLAFIGSKLLLLGSTLIIPPAQAEESNWHCKENRVTGAWQCGLPNKALPVAATNIKANTDWFTPAFSESQERVFKNLQQHFEHDPWAMCDVDNAAISSFQPNTLSTQPLQQTDINANFGEMFDADYTHFWGDIDLKHEQKAMFSEQADYNQRSRVINLYGDVIYTDSLTALYSQSAKIALQDENRAILRNSLFVLPTTPIRGHAKALYRENDSLIRLKQVMYTSCEPGNQDWVLHADKMKINEATGSASIKHAWLEFKQVPILYLPYGSFPTDARRKSGLLMPAFGMSGRNGFDLSLPYYWDIAPNYDLTLTPRYMAKRGFMMGMDFRYLQSHSKGGLNIEILPEDNLENSTRWGGSFQHASQLTEQLKFDWDLNYVTDKAYFSDLDGSLGLGNRNRYLASRADMNYRLPWLNFNVHVDHFLNVDALADNHDVPYQRLPQLTLNLNKGLQDYPVVFALDSEYVVYQRHFDDGQVEGQRLNLKPAVSFPMMNESGFIIPKIALQHTQYWLSNQADTVNSNQSKTLPIISLDSGLFFERQFETLKHTIEPRLYYLYVPYTEQTALPNFDTSLVDFNSNQLFRDNVFNGADKTQNANQLTAALTTRLLKQGREALKLSVGEIFYFADRKVNLDSETVDKRWLSNLILELDSEITSELKLRSEMQWNYQDNEIDRGNVSLAYHDKQYGIFNIGYRYRALRFNQAAQEQVTASAIIPLYDGWSVIGLYRYSLFNRQTLEYFYGLEKDSCCWRFRIIARQFVRGDLSNNVSTDSKPENSVFFQLELKGFTSLGEKLEDFMLENIPSYQKPSR